MQNSRDVVEKPVEFEEKNEVHHRQNNIIKKSGKNQKKH